MQNHKTSRRAFLQASAGTVGAAALSSGLVASLSSGLFASSARGDEGSKGGQSAGKPLKLLVLGGTAFLGPSLIEQAKARGHSVTTFNRGKTEKRIGSIDGIEKLFGNRDPRKRADDADAQSPMGLSQIEEAIANGQTWDAVIDTSGYVPRHVRASAELLGKVCGQYVFISTISVYARNDEAGADEGAALAMLNDPLTEDFQNPQNYGPLKAGCERAAEQAMPGKVTTIRPGFIVGPGDPTDRFTYWPVRAAQGGEMLWPGGEGDPVQLIDVRDLAGFVLLCIERGTMGTMNATGPSMTSERPMTQGELAAACAKLAPKDNPLKPTWASWEFLQTQEGVNTTVLIPPVGEASAFHRRSYAKALGAGLTLRSIDETCADTLAWWPKEVARRERVGRQLIEDAEKAGKPMTQTLEQLKAMRQGMSSEVETRVLAAWRAKK